MSENNSIDFRQDRRQWLKTSATMLGASLLPLPSAAELPEQSESKSTPAPEKSTSHKSVGHFFTPAQHALVDELCETIIPADSHSGGSKAAKVVDYIDVTLRDTFDDAKKSTWREGLRLIDIMSTHYHGKTFVDASPDDRIALLTVLSNNDHMTDLPEVRFFVELKRMTVTGYYTSKIGIHDELEYKGNRILKEFVGCDDQHLANS